MAEQNSEIKELRIRKTYINGRLPQLREELKAFTQEKAQLTQKMRILSSLGTTEQKLTRERNIYVTRRLEILKSELKSLYADRKDALDKLKAKQRSA